jgi:phage shock protein PspC (stress-responsive transcriptional regulator)
VEAVNLTGRGPLRRSRRHRLIAGVCGGVAEWRGWNATAVRALFVVGSLVPIVPGFVVYVVLWLVVPRED